MSEKDIKIDVYVRSRGSLGKINESNREMIIHSYCAPESYSNAIQSLGKNIVNGILSSEEQLLLSNLTRAIKSTNEKNSTVTLNDTSKLLTRVKAWFTYRTTVTPLIIIGNSTFKGAPSVEELIEAINNQS
ncbi:MAG: hypothetical protein ACXAC8_17380 [Candidatus Hodarchaeales archaeon]